MYHSLEIEQPITSKFNIKKFIEKHWKLLLLIIVLLLIGLIIGLYFALSKPSPPKPKITSYNCTANLSCVKISGNTGMSKRDCDTHCKPGPAGKKTYNCNFNNYTCELAGAGTGRAIDDCKKLCKKPKPPPGPPSPGPPSPNFNILNDDAYQLQFTESIANKSCCELQPRTDCINEYTQCGGTKYSGLKKCCPGLNCAGSPSWKSCQKNKMKQFGEKIGAGKNICDNYYCETSPPSDALRLVCNSTDCNPIKWNGSDLEFRVKAANHDDKNPCRARAEIKPNSVKANKDTLNTIEQSLTYTFTITTKDYDQLTKFCKDKPGICGTTIGIGQLFHNCDSGKGKPLLEVKWTTDVKDGVKPDKPKFIVLVNKTCISGVAEKQDITIASADFKSGANIPISISIVLDKIKKNATITVKSKNTSKVTTISLNNLTDLQKKPITWKDINVYWKIGNYIASGGSCETPIDPDITAEATVKFSKIIIS